jgi:hypothetical protein
VKRTLPAGHVRVRISFEGDANEVTQRLIEFLRNLPREEAQQAVRSLALAARAVRKKALRVVRGGKPR